MAQDNEKLNKILKLTNIPADIIRGHGYVKSLKDCNMNEKWEFSKQGYYIHVGNVAIIIFDEENEDEN